MLRNYAVLLTFIVVSHQAVYRPGNAWMPFSYPYFLGLPNAGQVERAAYLNGFYDGGRLGINPPAEQPSNDVRARFRAPNDQDSSSVINETSIDNAARLFFNGGTIGNGATANYLLKTSFVFTTLTATLCYMSTCIPAGQFIDGSSNIICRRKRDAVEDPIPGIEPSNVEQMEPTAFMTLIDPTFQHVPKESQLTINSVPLLDSSIEDQPESSQQFGAREKRFLYLLTTTVTTYKFLSSTYTTTISPAGPDGGALSCRPSGVSIC